MSKCASLRRRGRSCLTEARRAQWSLVCVKGTGCTRMRAGYSCRAAEVTNVRGACNATVGRSPTSSLARPVTTAKVLNPCVRALEVVCRSTLAHGRNIGTASLSSLSLA